MVFALAKPIFAQEYNFFDQIPKYAPKPIIPRDNPMNLAKITLGRYLFYDKRLSKDGTIACATCHQQSLGFADGQATSMGVNGEFGHKSAMALVNLAYYPAYTWANPNIRSLEQQILTPIFGDHPIEMGMMGRESQIINLLKTDKIYKNLMPKAFNGNNQNPIKSLTQAIAAFERSLISFNSDYDKFVYGNKSNALSPSAKRGLDLFFGEKLECHHCHGGINFTDNNIHQNLPNGEAAYHNTGLYNIDGKGSYPKENIGIMEFSGNFADMGKFRTPSLRNIALSAPYMHDGSLATLDEVIDKHYAKGGRARSLLTSSLINKFSITDEEKKDLIEFLKSLTDNEFLTNKKFSNPFPAN